jgi:hypothetical protein
MATVTSNQQLVTTVLSSPNTYKARSCSAVEDVAALDKAFENAVRLFERDRWSRAIVFPRRDAQSETLTWYACAQDETEFRSLVSEMAAFVGPTFSDFTGERARLNETDPIEMALDQFFRQRVLKFQSTSPVERKGAARQLAFYLGLRANRPAIAPLQLGSFGSLRARFDAALLAGNAGEAHSVLRTMRSLRLLSAENSLFLDIRTLAGLQRWQEIASHKLLPQLVSLQLPRETFADILEALYQVEIQPLEFRLDLRSLVEAFQEKVFDRFPSLFRTRHSSSRIAVLKAFLLRAIDNKTRSKELFSSISRQIPESAWAPPIAVAIKAYERSLSEEVTLEQAKAAVQAGDFDQAAQVLTSLPVSGEVVHELLACARETESKAVAELALARLAQCDGPTKERLRRELPKTLEKVQEIARQALVTASRGDDWVERFCDDRQPPDDEYVAWMREGAEVWDPADERISESQAKRMSAHLTALAIDRPEVFERVYPLLYRLFIDRSEKSLARLLPIYIAMLETVRQRGTYGEDERKLLGDVSASALECAPSGRIYRQILNELVEFLGDVRSPRMMDWAIDMAEELMKNPCADPEARLRFLTSVFSMQAEFKARIAPLQAGMLAIIREEAGLPKIAEPDRPETDLPLPSYDHLRIGLFTLDENAGKRAAQLLRSLFTGLTVEVSQDRVCTDRLKNLAKRVDLFGFAWKTSSHQAYYCVKDHIADAGRLVYAPGKGSGSLVRALSERLTALAA